MLRHPLIRRLGGPLSEQYGRRIITRITFSLVVIWTLACALAPSWPAFLVFRFLCGAAAGGPIAVVAGIIADTYGNPIERGRSMAWFMAVRRCNPSEDRGMKKLLTHPRQLYGAPSSPPLSR